MPLFAEFWDKIADAIIGSIPILLGLLAAYIDLRRKARDMRKATDTKLEGIRKTGEATYHLSNSAMEEQKRLLAVTARAKAGVTNDPVDIAAAEVAEEAYQKHHAKQDQLDARTLPPLEPKAGE